MEFYFIWVLPVALLLGSQGVLWPVVFPGSSPWPSEGLQEAEEAWP